MLDMARKIAAKTKGVSRRKYNADENLRLTLAHLIQTIGEAARRVSPEFRDAYPQIPWGAIVGMRHKVVHDYMNVDINMVWQTATQEIGPLIAALEKLTPREDREA